MNDTTERLQNVARYFDVTEDQAHGIEGRPIVFKSLLQNLPLRARVENTTKFLSCTLQRLIFGEEAIKNKKNTLRT